MKKKPPVYLRLLIALIVCAALLCCASAVVCTYSLSVKEYTIPIEGIRQDIRIAVISDLHSRRFGRDNERLLSAVAAQEPAAVFCLGDMINNDADAADLEELCAFLRNLQNIAQVYYTLGNTEMDCPLGPERVLAAVNETGAIAMLDDYLETEIGGNRVNVGFTMGHYKYYSRKLMTAAPDYVMEKSVGSDGTPAIVLRHMPEGFFADGHETWTGDLYLCGHTHGGLFRIPRIGGVYAPNQGFFPKYDRGLYHFDDGKYTMIINAGLAGRGRVPRIFNMPEVSVITLTGTG